VLKQVAPSVMVGERERKQFIDMLGQYAKKRQHKIVLVFDGGPYERVSQERVSGIYVVYSGALETADDYIKRYLEEHKALDLLLVSSDRELRSAAARYEIESIRASEFYKTVQEALQSDAGKSTKKAEAIKTAEDEDQELDEVMRKGSKVVQSKVEDFVSHKQSRKSKAHRPSKKERKRMKKIKKL